jgi:hypothetical protein
MSMSSRIDRRCGLFLFLKKEHDDSDSSASPYMDTADSRRWLSVSGGTDFLGLRLIVHGIPLLSLLAVVRDCPLALSKLLRLRVRHIGGM